MGRAQRRRRRRKRTGKSCFREKRGLLLLLRRRRAPREELHAEIDKRREGERERLLVGLDDFAFLVGTKVTFSWGGG